MNTIEIKVILNLSLNLSHSHLILYDLDSTILLAQLCFGEKIYRDYVIETQYECLTHITHRKLEIISSLNSFPLISNNQYMLLVPIFTKICIPIFTLN